MTAADQIRVLADTGTPRPWRAASWGEHGLWTLRGTRDDVWLADVRDPGDAAKIVAAMNALPALADLIDAIDALPTYLLSDRHDPECDGLGCSHPIVFAHHNVTAARDALLAALGVTQ